MKRFTWLLYGLLLLAGTTYAQKGEVVNFSAAKIKGATEGGVPFRIYEGSPQKRVVITKGGSTVYCDLAKENLKTNVVVATGNVIVKDKTTTITGGDRMDFSRGKGEVIISGKKVVLVDKDVKVTSNKLYYDTNKKTASYLTGGTVIQKEMELVSKKGYLKEKTLEFMEDVVLDDPAKGQHLETDKLIYDRPTEIAYFETPTKIRSKEGDAVAKKGNYNTKTGKVLFEGNAVMENDDYILVGDRVDTDKNSGNSIAVGSVILYSKKDSVTIYADEVHHSDNRTKAFGRALMARPLMGDLRNQLYLSADTLFSEHDSVSKETTLHAYNKVRINSRDMQAKCDSMVFYSSDSMMYFYDDPIMWGNKSQMVAKTIKAMLTSKGLDKVFLDRDAFMINEDTLGNYNQIKGKNIVAEMKDSKLHKLDVKGNGQTLAYYLSADSKSISNIDKASCNHMVINFSPTNANDFTMEFLESREGTALTPEQLKPEEARLPGFKLRTAEAPQRPEFVDRIRVRADDPRAAGLKDPNGIKK